MLQAESQRTYTFSEFSLECNSTSVICRRPLTSVTDGKPELPSAYSFIFVVPVQVDVSGFHLLGAWSLMGKIRSGHEGKKCGSFHIRF